MILLTRGETAHGESGEADDQQRMGGQHDLSQARVRALVNAERGKSLELGGGHQDRHQVERQGNRAQTAGRPRDA